jgi:hypothetical protein
MIKVIIATHHRYIKNEIMNNHYVSLSAVNN